MTPGHDVDALLGGHVHENSLAALAVEDTDLTAQGAERTAGAPRVTPPAGRAARHPSPTSSADAGEVVHLLCCTCWPSYTANDGERFALCGADMRDEREVATAGPADRCEACKAAASSHWHGGAR